VLFRSPSLADGIPVLDMELGAPPEIEQTRNLPVVSDVVTADEVTMSDVAIIEVDASGLNCPGPIMKLAKTMNKANAGDIVRITATDSGFGSDVKTWCEKKGHRLLEFKDSRAKVSALLLKC